MNVTVFIREIRKRAPLWDQKQAAYHNKRLVNELWTEISKIFNMPVKKAKAKWKNLRDTFRAELKRVARYANADGENLDPSFRHPWVHFNDMLFVKKFLKTRKSYDLLDTGHYDPTVIENSTVENVKVEPSHCPSPVILDPDDGYFDFKIQEITSVSSQDHEEDSLRSGVKRKLQEEDEISNSNEEVDDDLFFFKSLLPYVKKLSPDKKLLFRTNVQQMLYNELYNNNNN